MRTALTVAFAAIALLTTTANAEVTRTLRAELQVAADRPFTVENLAGQMTITGADVTHVVAIATVHAEDDEWAEQMRLEEVRGTRGEPTLRVIYPLRRNNRIRYPHGGDSNFEYDGRDVRVSERRGVLLYADIEIQVPKHTIIATFRNWVGQLTARELEGRILLDAASANILATALTGDIKADTGSGDVEAKGIAGSFECDTGSGACYVVAFKGDELRCDTGSGEVRVKGVTADLVWADTGSGSVRVEDADIERLHADTGSGNVTLEVTGARLRRVNTDTGSGDVTVYLPADASFDLRADVGNGDIVSRFRDAEPVHAGRELVGFKRGDERIRIDVDTGSGDVEVSPLR